MKLAILSSFLLSNVFATANCHIKNIADETNSVRDYPNVDLTTTNAAVWCTGPLADGLDGTKTCAGTTVAMSTAIKAVDNDGGGDAAAQCSGSGPCTTTVTISSSFVGVLEAGDFLTIKCVAGYRPSVASVECVAAGSDTEWASTKWACVKTSAPTTTTKAPVTKGPTTSAHPTTATVAPTVTPTANPTKSPTKTPTANPTTSTKSPTTDGPTTSAHPTTGTVAPTASPTAAPTRSPTTAQPTLATDSPTRNITKAPTTTAAFSSASLLSPKEFVTVLAVLVCTARLVV